MKRICLIINCLLLLLINTVRAQQLTNSNALSYSAKTNLIIENKIFTSGGSNGALIYLANCSDITIRNCIFKNAGQIGIQVNASKNINIYGCLFDSVRTGVYATNCTGGLVINCNSFKDIIGPKPRGQMVQFNACTGAGNRINNNILEQTTGVGAPEDLVKLYASYGTVADPIQVSGNKTRGGGPSTSGGGLMLGDNGSHDIIADNNILVNPGQYGIAAPSGWNMKITNNTVYSASFSYTNVGLYVGLSSEITAGFACTGNTITVSGNKVNWKNKTNVQNDFYYCACCPNVVNSGNTGKASISASILPTTMKLSNTCTNLNLNCSVLGTACPTVTDIEEELAVDSQIVDWEIVNCILSASIKENSVWKLTSLDGRILFAVDNTQSIEASLKNYPAGIYMLIIQSPNQNTHIKFNYSHN